MARRIYISIPLVPTVLILALLLLTIHYPISASVNVPLTHLSVRRTLKGSSQSDAQLSLVIENNLPVLVRTSYLETMPWLLQFYLHTIRAQSDGVPRGTCIRADGAIPASVANLILLHNSCRFGFLR